MSFIKVKNLHKSFGQVHALRGFEASFEQAEQYAITGSSGSGKSTFLYLLGGLDQVDKGEIFINDELLSSFDDLKRSQYRNQTVGFVFQFHFLLPNMKGLQNVLLPAQIGDHNIGEVKKRCLHIAEHLGVVSCLEKFPYELSGGEQQRVSIIRALSLKPKLLLCDEPTGNLDSKNSQKVNGLIQQLAREFKATLIVVTHDQHIAQSYANELHMIDGKLS